MNQNLCGSPQTFQFDMLRLGHLRSAIAVPLMWMAVAFAGCTKPVTNSSAPTADRQREEIDACALLSSEEIAAIQGAPLQSTTPSRRTHAGADVAQCYFRLPTAADSLTLAVFRKSAGDQKQTPASLWQEMFHHKKPPRAGRDGKLKQEPAPPRVDGVGDEAFWSGGQFGGTLHVRKGEDTFQLSVGGPGDEAAKLESLKQLAAKIVERL